MDMDKRYCQNRQRKRKRIITPRVESQKVSPSEEERQFKLRRFVDDVGKFVLEKQSYLDQHTKSQKIKSSSHKQGIVKKVLLPKAVIKKSLAPHCGLQTKLCTRGAGVLTREMTARLDENLQKIISLNNDNRCSHRCHCAHQCIGNVDRRTYPGPLEHRLETESTSVLRPLQLRSSASAEDCSMSYQSPCSLVGPATSTGHVRKSLSDLDKELYPVFARVVSISCTETKSKLFKNQSYVSAVKRKLLQIYVNGLKEAKQEGRCSNEPKKATSSVGTSPFPSPTKTQSSQHSTIFLRLKDAKQEGRCSKEPKKATSSVGTSPFPSPTKTQSSQHSTADPPFKFAPAAPAKMSFKSTMQFLEETIGPRSSSSEVPPPQFCRPKVQYHQPTTSLLLSPVVGYERPRRVFSHLPKTSRYLHEPFISSSIVSPLQNFKPNFFDGSGDRFGFNCSNSFLPQIEEEEDSPDFRYFPKKII